MADDTLELRADAAQYIQQLEKAVAVLTQLYNAQERIITQSTRLNNVTGQIQTNFSAIEKGVSAYGSKYAYINGQWKLMSSTANTLNEDLPTITRNINAIAQAAARSAIRVGDFKNAMAAAKDIQLAPVREQTIAEIKTAQIQQPIDTKNFTRNLRRGFEEEVRQLPTIAQSQFKQIERTAAATAAQMGLTWDQLKTKLAAIRAGEIKLIPEGEQARLQNALLALGNQFDKLERIRANQLKATEQARVSREASIRGMQLEQQSEAKVFEQRRVAREAAIRKLQEEQQLNEKITDQRRVSREKSIRDMQLEQKAETQIFEQRRVAREKVLRDMQLEQQKRIEAEAKILETQRQATVATTVQRTLKAPVVEQLKVVPLDTQKQFEEASLAFARFASKYKLGVQDIRNELLRLEKEGFKAFNPDTQPIQRGLQAHAVAYKKALGEVIDASNAMTDSQKKLANQQQSQSLQQQRISAAYSAYADLQRKIASGSLTQLETETRKNYAMGRTIETLRAVNKAGKEFTYEITRQGSAITNVQEATRSQTEANKQLYLSWQSIIRLAVVQAMHQIVSSFVSGFQQSIQTAQQLQIQIAQIQTISEAGIDTSRWMQGILDISNATGLVASDVASGVYDTLSNQIADGARALEFMSKAGRLAMTTNSSLQDSVNAVSSAMNSYGVGLEEQSRIQGIFFRMIDLGRIKMPEFANQLGRVLPGANELGISLEEVAAFMSATTRQGITAANAMTYLFNIFSRLLKPAGEMKEFLRGIGVESGSAAIATYGFANVIEKIAKFAEGRPELSSQLFPDIRGLRGILAVTGKHVQDFTNDLDSMRNSLGADSEAFEYLANNSGKKFQIELERIRNYFTGDWGNTIIEKLVEINDQFLELHKIVRLVADAGLVFGGPLLLGGLVSFIQNSQVAMTALRALTVGAGGPVAALSVLVLALKYAADSSADALEKMQEDYDAFYKDQQEKARRHINETLKPVDDAIRIQVTGIRRLLADLTKGYDKFATDTERAAESTINSLKELNDEFLNFLQNTLSDQKKVLNDLESSIKKIDEFTFKEPERIRKTQIKRDIAAEEDPAKQQKLIIAEYKRLEEQIKKTKDTEERLFLGREAKDLLEDLYRIQTASEKEAIKNANERDKLLRDRKKSIEKIAELEKKADIDKLKTQDKINSQSKKGPVVTINGVVQPTNRGTERLGLETSLAQDKINRQLEEERNKLGDINKQLNETKTTRIEILDVQKLTTELFELEKKLNQEDRDILLQKQKEQEAAIVKTGLAIKEIRSIFSDLEKFKIDQLLKPDVDQKKFDELFNPQLENINKLRVKIEENATIEFDKKKDLLDRLYNYEQTLIDAQTIFKGRENVKQAQTAINNVEEQQKKERDNLAKLSSNIPAYMANIMNAGAELSVRIENDTTGIFSKLPASLFENYKKAYQAMLKDFNQDTVNTFKAAIDNYYQARSAQAKASGAVDAQGRFMIGGSFVKPMELLFGGIKTTVNGVEQTTKGYIDVLLESQQATDQSKQSIDKLTKQINEQTAKLSTQFEVDLFAIGQQQRQIDQTDKLIDINSQLVTQMKLANAGLPEKYRNTTEAVTTKAFGGFMHGSDNIPALLSKGEFVVNANATRRFYSQLVSMNQVRGYANGGLVTNVGDINVSMSSSGNAQADIVAIGKGLRREIRRGRVRLS